MSRQRIDEGCEEKADYPFALVLRLRVVQIVCGISILIMGTVALIEEKTPYNLGMGVSAGLATVLAAANSIYCSRGFDGYQPSNCKASSALVKLRILGPTAKSAAVNVILWTCVVIFIIAVTFKATNSLLIAQEGLTIPIIASTELILSVCVFLTICAVAWVDTYYDPDCQEPPDLAHSNTGTAVSMVTLSQAPQ